MNWKRVVFAAMLVSLMLVSHGYASGELKGLKTVEQSEMAPSPLAAQTSLLNSTILSALLPTMSSSLSMVSSISTIINGVSAAFDEAQSLIQQLGSNTALAGQLPSLTSLNTDLAAFLNSLDEARVRLEGALEALNGVSSLGIKAAVEAAEEGILAVEGVFRAASTLIASADGEVEKIDRLLRGLLLVVPSAAETFSGLVDALDITDEVVRTANEMIDAALQLTKAIKEGLKAVL